jgi:hypothetical protein
MGSGRDIKCVRLYTNVHTSEKRVWAAVVLPVVNDVCGFVFGGLCQLTQPNAPPGVRLNWITLRGRT